MAETNGGLAAVPKYTSYKVVVPVVPAVHVNVGVLETFVALEAGEVKTGHVGAGVYKKEFEAPIVCELLLLAVTVLTVLDPKVEATVILEKSEVDVASPTEYNPAFVAVPAP